MCRTVRITLATFVLAVANLGLLFAAHDEDVGAGTQRRTVGENLPGQVAMLFAWPDLKSIPAEKIVEGTENKAAKRARRSSLKWIKKVIDPNFLPPSDKELDGKLTMVRDEHGPIDASHAEWEKQGYILRVTQSRTVLAISITPAGAGATVTGDTLEAKSVSAAKVCERIVADIRMVKATTREKEVINIVPEGTRKVLLAKSFSEATITQYEDGIGAVAAEIDFDKDQDRRSHNYWWRRMAWWTNGRSLHLYTFRIEHSAWKPVYGASADNTWF
ncbi:MAG: hypothetical protein ACYTEX_27430 [Planctomycetota bacterium]|jgi:hypothetical protein